MKQFFTLFLILLTFGAINAQTTILSEDFENGLPDGWTADNYWEFGNSSAISSQYFTIPDHTNFAGFNDDDLGTTVASGKIVTSGIALDSFSAAILVFDAFFFNGDYDADETAKVLASNDGGTTWDEVVDIGGAGDWQSIEVGLVEYVGDTVWLAFEYNDGGGWNYGLGVDNILVYEPIARDIKFTSVTTKRYHEVNSDVVITGVVANRGAETLNSFDLSWSDGVNTYTDSIVDLSISPLGTYEFSHSSTKNLGEAIQYGVEVWTSNPNGADDLMLGNDTTSTVLNGVSYIPTKKVVAEEGTGAWCGWCTGGAVFMDNIAENNENFIGIAVHNDDPMVVGEYDNGVGAFPGFDGYPGIIFDRLTALV
ncbi:MAG: hypothetical protein GY705_24275, partial [Bacteroidetes bacterium]|nr:hypothetical protein [Bacteroidota bacterium]